MTDRKAQNDFNKALFTNLVMMLGSSAMQQMGKLVNPMTNKTEMNLEGAQVTIDMLSMIKEKTKGNLDDDENKIMNDLISSLQMNYVETSNSAPKSETKEATEDKTETDVDDNKEDQETSKKETEEGKDPKFHKSYDEKK